MTGAVVIPVPTPEQVTTFVDGADENPWVLGPPPDERVVLVDPDPAWPARYEQQAARIRTVLGDRVLALDHVGSTSVPDLVAKDVIDVDLTVADTADEAAYVSPLTDLGYVLTVREPGWYGHRALRLSEPRVNLHVWNPGSPEAVRHQLFRDWLREHPDDRRAYEAAKRSAVPGGGTTMDYNARKQSVVREIYARVFAAAGLVSPSASPR